MQFGKMGDLYTVVQHEAKLYNANSLHNIAEPFR